MKDDGGCKRQEDLPVVEAIAEQVGDEEEGEVDVGGGDADEVDDDPGEEELSLWLSQSNQGNDVQDEEDCKTSEFCEYIEGKKGRILQLGRKGLLAVIWHVFDRQGVICSSLSWCYVILSDICTNPSVASRQQENSWAADIDVQDDEGGEEEIAESGPVVEGESSSCHFSSQLRPSLTGGQVPE